MILKVRNITGVKDKKYQKNKNGGKQEFYNGYVKTRKRNATKKKKRYLRINIEERRNDEQILELN